MRISKLLPIILAVVLAGCAADPDKKLTRDISQITPAEPPTFLNTDVAGLFGKTSFSARVEVQKGIPGSRPPIVGQLFGRDGSLFFITDDQRARSAISTGLSALWDAPSQTAYLLDEPLQGYAPIRGAITNGPVEIVEAGEEQLGSERCRKLVINRRVA